MSVNIVTNAGWLTEAVEAVAFAVVVAVVVLGLIVVIVNPDKGELVRLSCGPNWKGAVVLRLERAVDGGSI